MTAQGNQGPSGTDKYHKYNLQSYLIIQGHFYQGIELLFYVRVTSLYDKYQVRNDPYKVVTVNNRTTNNKYFGLCLNKCHHFIPFISSAYIMVGQESTKLFNSLDLKCSRKWNHPYSHVWVYLKAQMYVFISVQTITASMATGLHIKGVTVSFLIGRV